ncbi:MAG: thioredoxin fold domain-containing protein [Bacteroidetes bacterium]|nr:thioredoxin fold domain-containing protein [Bacteroidota bacterium]
MRKLIIFVLISTVCFAFKLQDDETKKPPKYINFYEGSLSSAGKVAKRDKKLIVLFVTSEECEVCRQLKQNFKDEELKEFYKKSFVVCHMDPNKLANNFRLTNWGVSEVPTLLFMDTKTKILLKVSGYKSKDELITAANDAIDIYNKKGLKTPEVKK